MSSDVPKLVRSPRCDHGHNEESRNGRDIKIDILDGYIRTREVFWVISEKTGVPEGLPEPPGEVLGLSGPKGRERAAAQEGEGARGRCGRPGRGAPGGVLLLPGVGLPTFSMLD